MFQVKLALLCVFIRLNFVRQALLDTFLCSPSFDAFFLPAIKKVWPPTPDLDCEELSDIGSLHLNLAHLKLEVLEPLAKNCIRCILKYAKKFVQVRIRKKYVLRSTEFSISISKRYALATLHSCLSRSKVQEFKWPFLISAWHHLWIVP